MLRSMTIIPFQLPLKDSRAGPPWMVTFLEPPVQLMLAELRSEPAELVSMDATVTVVDGRPAEKSRVLYMRDENLLLQSLAMIHRIGALCWRAKGRLPLLLAFLLFLQSSKL